MCSFNTFSNDTRQPPKSFKSFQKLDFFISDHHTFFSLFKVRLHVIVCINHDIVVGPCSELLMRLFYYIHLICGKINCLTWRSNHGPSDCEPSTVPLDQKANFIIRMYKFSRNLIFLSCCLMS